MYYMIVTAKLPRVKLEPQGPDRPEHRAGDPAGCVSRSIRGAVKELVEQYATKLGTWPDIICTGGDAAALFGPRLGTHSRHLPRSHALWHRAGVHEPPDRAW